MDTLETASDRLVNDPVAPPPSIHDLRARTARRQRRRLTGRLAAAVVVVGALVAGSLQLVGGDETQEVEVIDRPGAGSQTFQDLLRLVPLTDGALSGGELRMYDHATVREALDIAAPGNDPDDVLRYIVEMPLVPQRGIAAWSAAAPDKVRAELGYDPAHVDRLVQYVPFLSSDSAESAENMVISEGPVDPDIVDRTVRAVPYWGERTVADPVEGGATLYQWGGDPDAIDIEHQTPVRRIGRPHALAVADGWAAFTQRPDTARAAAELRDGEGPSLADDPEFRRLVALADGRGAQVVSIMPMVRRSTTGVQPPMGSEWAMETWRSGPDGTSATLTLLLDGDAAVDEAMQQLADRDPEQEGDLVWITIDGDDESVAADLAEAKQAVDLPW